MAEYYKGTLLASPIVRGFSGDTYGTHHSILSVGGYMEIDTIAKRDLIPPISVTQINNLGMSLNFDGLSIGQRRLGMLVFVQEEGTVYQLQIPQATWSGYTSTQKQNALVDNTNWEEYFSGVEEAERISKIFSQTTHTFVKGDAIGYDGNDYLKINNTGLTSNYVVLGLVSEVSDVDTFKLTYVGNINTNGILDYTGATLSAGTTYYVANTLNAGELTKYIPTGLNTLVRPILLQTSGNTGVVIPNRGTKKTEEGVSYGVFSGYTGTTQVFLDKTVTGATNIGYFSGMTGIQTLDLSGTFTCTGDFNSVFNNYYRDDGGIIRLGSPTYCGDCRRGYVHTNSDYSWIYNEYTGSSNCVGWIQVAADIRDCIGSFVNGVVYDYSGGAYTAVTWTGFTSRGSTSIMPSGDLWTGTTYEVDGPLYRDKLYQELRLRTICSKTPDSIRICYDDNFIQFSGISSTQGLFFADNGLTKSGQSVILGGTLTGDTTINVDGNTFCITDTDGSGTIILGNSFDTYVIVSQNEDTVCLGNYAGGKLMTSFDSVKIDAPTICMGTGCTINITTDSTGNQISATGDLTISVPDSCALILAGGSSSNVIFFGTSTMIATNTVFCVDGSATDIGMDFFTKGSALMRLRACCVFIGAPSASYAQGIMICESDICLAYNTTICGGAGYLGNVDAQITTICGGIGYSTGGHGGDVNIYGGAGVGASCTGGTLAFQAGTGTGGDGRVVINSLPAKTTETSLVYIDSVGRLSCGGVTQQPVTICTDGNYTSSNSDYFVGTCSGRTIFLPALPITGEIKVVADICGAADSNNYIIVNGNGELILDWANALIETDWGSISFMYNGTDWNVIGFTATPTYCT